MDQATDVDIGMKILETSIVSGLSSCPSYEGSFASYRGMKWIAPSETPTTAIDVGPKRNSLD